MYILQRAYEVQLLAQSSGAEQVQTHANFASYFTLQVRESVPVLAFYN